MEKISLSEICDKLRIKPEFFQFITAEIEGRSLGSSTAKFSQEKGLLITLSYTPKSPLGDNGVTEKKDRNPHHQRHPASHMKPVPTTFSPKKKSPSRRRRDRERFRKFLEQKKKRKQTANSPQQSHSQGCH